MAVIPHPAGLTDPYPVAPARELAVWAGRAAEFADEVVAPLGLVLDRMAPRAARVPASPLLEFIALATEERFTRLTDRVADGGAGLCRAVEYEVLETLAAADAGLTSVLVYAPLPFRFAGRGHRRLRRRLAQPFLAGDRREQRGCLVASAAGALRLSRDGTGWRLHGATRHPVTGGAAATHAAVACQDARATRRALLAIVPLDRAGVRRSPSLHEPGLRGRVPARLVFDDVRLEHDEVLDERWGGERIALSLGAVEHLTVAVGCIGLARAAYEGAARWRGERGLDGARQLARMRGELDTARGAVRLVFGREYARLDAGEAMRAPHALTVHALATRTAALVTRRAMALCGAHALDDEGVAHLDRTRFHPQKLLRDAIAGSAARPGRIPSAAPVAAQPQPIGSMQWAT